MPYPLHLPRVLDQFQQRFRRRSTVVARAPGRVNLIGEHTDYNEGLVLPMATEHGTWVAAAPRADDQVRAISLDLGDDECWPLDAWGENHRAHWTGYVAGVAALLRRRGVRLTGADLLIQSSLPIGGGLASSAALEVATALALVTIGGARLPATELADLCREAEHECAGVPCGIMDQYVSILARTGCALLLDCRTRRWEHIALPLADHAVLVVDSGVRHDLAASAYSVRRNECDTAVEYFRRTDPRVRTLRDVDVNLVMANAPHMESPLAARALHVTTENERTRAAASALRRGDLITFGRLLSASHASLRDDHEVSCRELDLLVELLTAVPGVLGARLTGAGFGGCVVALATCDCVPQVEATLREKYDAAGFGPARIIRTRPGAGAAVEVAEGA